MPSLFFIDAWIIWAGLTAALLVAAESGYRFGARHATESRSSLLLHEVPALGVLALLLGFSFSMAAQRFETKRELIIAEANAVGTAMLRSQLLTEPYATQAAPAFKKYIDLRITLFDSGLDEAGRTAALQESEQIHEVLWVLARDAHNLNRLDVGTGLFIQAVNDVIDAHGKRKAASRYHLPDAVYFLIFSVAICAFGLSGIAAGVQQHRSRIPTFVMVALVSAVIFFITDLDRPQRGLVTISDQSFLDLAASLKATPR